MLFRSPNVSYAVTGGIEAGAQNTEGASYAGSGSGGAVAASLEEAEENYFHDILEQLFSYEDYLHFIDLYTKVQEVQEEEEEEKEKDQKSDSYQAYKGFQYSPVSLNLTGI